MRLFIKNYNLNKLNSKIKLLDKYLVNTTKHYDIFSNDGNFQIDNSNTYRIIHKDKCLQLFENYLNNFTILVDYSVTMKIQETQIPVDSIVIPVQNKYYSLNKNSKIKLFIQTKDDLDENIILDFYFILDDKENDINNIFIKDELNVFLSLLN